MKYLQKKKKLLLTLFVIAFLTGSISNAQNKKNKESLNLNTQIFQTENYEKIKIVGPFKVKLIKGKVGEIKVMAKKDNADTMVINSDGTTLTVSQNPNNHNLVNKDIILEIPVEVLNYVSLVGSGNVTSNLLLTEENLEFEMNGSGSLNFEIAVKQLDANLNGSGNIVLSGEAENANIKATGSGEFNCKTLQTKKAEMYVAGSGSANINSSENLKARVDGSGSIKYYGNPTKVDEKVRGSGSITRAN